ncbi:MAG: Crp/Fnr family transcriptional regulator, partial [Cellulosilyticaceae bacterium]
RFMYTNLYDKFSKVILDKEEMTHESIPDRLIKYLKKKNTPIIYTTHQEIASNLGTAREVVSRNLKKLEQDGLIQLERNKIKVLTWDK